MKRVCWGLVVGLLSLMFSLNAANKDVTFDPKEEQLRSLSELLPGEKIDFHTGEVSHYMEMVSIEGNGLPIKLGHRFFSSSSRLIQAMGQRGHAGMMLDIPRIEFTHRGKPYYNILQHNNGDHINGGYRTNIQCSELMLASDAILTDNSADDSANQIVTNKNFVLNTSVKLKVGYDSVHFFPKGHESSSRFPASASLVSPSNWYVECVASSNVVGKNAFKAVSPSGVVYLFDRYEEKHPSVSGNNDETKAIIYLSSITDKHGNQVNYNYNQFDYHNGDDVLQTLRLKSITAGDGRILNITYSDGASPSYPYLNWIRVKSNSSANPVNLVYRFPAGDRTTIEREDGKFWKYTYSPIFDNGAVGIGGYKIDSIEYPNGLKVAYEYIKRDANLVRQFEQPINHSVEHYSLKKRIISGYQVSHVENYNYDNTGFFDPNSTDTTFIKSPTQSIQFKYRKINFTKDPLSTSVNSSKLISKSYYPTGTTFSQRSSKPPLEKISYEYVRVAGVIDLNYLRNNWILGYTFSRYYGLLKDTHHSYRTLLKKKTTTKNGYTFIVNKSNFDQWGHSRTISEFNDLPYTKTTRRTFYNNTTSWVIGKLKTESVDAETAKSTFAYNADGTLRSKTIAGISEYYSYHSDGNLYQIKKYKNGSVQPIKAFTNYYRGIARNIRDGEGNIKTVQVLDSGLIKSETDFNGNPPTFYQYDSIRRLEQINYPSQVATLISWPSEVQKIIKQGGYQKIIDFNAMMQPVLISEEDRNISGSKIYTKTTYDAGGRVLLASFPSSNRYDNVGREYTYDGLGRPMFIKNTGDNSTTSYCYGKACGQGTKHGILITDPRNYRTIKNYSSFGNPDEKNLVSIKEQKIGRSAFIKTTIYRGRFGQIKSIDQGGKNRAFTYKSGTLLLATKTDPETGTTFFNYDNRGNILQSRVGASSFTYFTYDNNDRITRINYPGSTDDVNYTYDGTNLDKITTGANKTILEYLWTPENKIKYETLKIDGLIFVTHYQYDFLGNIKSIRLPSAANQSSSRVVNIGVDALGRTRNINGFVNSISYHPNGVISSMRYANNQILTGNLNSKRLPSKILTAKGGKKLVDLSYYYDKTNNVIRIVDGVQGGNSRRMTYDGLGRMITANGRWGSGKITYTNNHDIDTLTLGGSILAYGYQSGKLTHTTGFANKNFSYDHYGNVISNGADSFIYDDASQLVKVSNKNINYRYDGNKKRVKVKTPLKTVYYFYNLAGELLYRYDNINKKDVEYINLNGKLIAKLEHIGIASGSIPTVTSYWSPSTVSKGQTSTYHWASTHATSCLSANGTARAPSGSVTLVRNTVGTSTSSITCTGAGGTSAPSYAKITVTNGASGSVPTVTSYWSPSTVSKGQTSTYHWASTHATSCLSANGTARAPSGSVTLVRNAVGTSTSSITCTGAGGTSAPSYARITVTNGGSSTGIPTPLTPSGKIATRTPIFTWTKVSSATSYTIKLTRVNGTVSEKTFIAAYTSCPNNVCSVSLGRIGPVLTFGGYLDSWQIKANNGSYSARKDFFIDEVVRPATTTLISPLGGTTDTTPSFTWNAVAGATSYNIQIFKGANIYVNKSITKDQANCSSGRNTCTFVSNLTFPYDYYTWKVKAINSAGSSAYSLVKSFTVLSVTTAPAVPTLISPTGNITDTTPTFKWNAVSGATSYELSLIFGGYTLREISALEAGCENGSGICSYTLDFNLSSSSGFINEWKIKALNSAGESAWSANKTFTVTGLSGSTIPEVISPVPNATLTGSAQTFNWRSNGNASATQYWLEVGTTQGGSDLFSENLGLSTSKTISGLPTDGSTVYVTLYYNGDPDWDSVTAIYTASGGTTSGSTTPEIISPAPNATLTGSAQTFNWRSNGNASATQYWLEIGTTQGGSDLFSENLGLSTSKTISGLPTDGSTVYVTLYYNDNWDSVKAIYTASGGTTSGSTTPEIISPAPNSTLSGSTQTFNWRSNGDTSVNGYWLEVGTTLGGSSIFSEDIGLATSKTVSGLPTDGTAVYVRLYYNDTNWDFVDFSFTGGN